jgi:polyhydroxyalkanoate synthase
VYTGARLLAGPVRFVLSNSGHIAGVVNPPGPKSRHWCGEGADLPADVADWRAAAVERTASWWTDWTPWIEARAGRRGRPPELGSAAHPPLADAPGSYVHA